MNPIFWLFMGQLALWVLFEAVTSHKKKATPQPQKKAAPESDMDEIVKIAALVKAAKEQVEKGLK